MKHTTIRGTFAVVAAAALAVVIAPTAHATDKGCSNSALTGTFAVTDNGVITAPASLAGPFADVGTLTFDGKGNTSGTAMASQSGNIFQLSLTGTYTVNPDCTGTFSLNVAVVNPPMTLGPTTAFFVIADSGNSFQSISTSPGRVVTTIGRAQALRLSRFADDEEPTSSAGPAPRKSRP